MNPTARPESSGEAGFALIEILISVMILGVAFAAILGGMATSINASDIHRQQSQVAAVLDSAIERVKSPTTAKVACAPKTQGAYVTAAQTAATDQGWAASRVTITLVEYWDGTTYGATCYDNPTNQLDLQRITLSVSDPQGRSPQTLSFIKGVG